MKVWLLHILELSTLPIRVAKIFEWDEKAKNQFKTFEHINSFWNSSKLTKQASKA